MSLYEELLRIVDDLDAAGLDYAMCGGIALAIVSTAGFVLINLVMDLLYPIIDPRVRSLAA